MTTDWLWVLLLPIGVLVYVRWLTRRAIDDTRIEMTDKRRAEIIRIEQGRRR